jgi:exosortase
MPHVEKSAPAWLPWMGVLVLWGLFFVREHLWWSVGSYYTYGWAVPPLAILLWWRRSESTTSNREKATTGKPWVLFALLAIYLPLRLLAEPDPFWRLPLWAEALALCGITLALARQNQGRDAWRTYAWPMVFLLTALPWPATAETWLVQGLSSQVTKATAETLLWLGHPAEAMGNQIMVDEKVIQIDASCSGIRSFQCLLAFGLFFGEYYRQRVSRRLTTLMVALALAFAFNLMRALALSMISLEGTLDTYKIWHDPIGFMAVCFAFASLWALSRNWEKSCEAGETSSEPEEKEFGQEVENAFRTSASFPLGKSVAWAFALGCLLPEAFTATWFRYLATPQDSPNWTVRWPNDENATIKRFPISKGVEDVLQFDYGERVEMDLAEMGKAEAHFFGYDGSDIAASLCSLEHSPYHCMQAMGVQLLGGQPEFIYMTRNGASLIFRHYVTGPKNDYGHYPMHIFWCPWIKDDRSGLFAGPDKSWSEKARGFLTGKISYERKVLLLVLFGHRDFHSAKKDLLTLLEQIVTEAPG